MPVSLHRIANRHFFARVADSAAIRTLFEGCDDFLARHGIALDRIGEDEIVDGELIAALGAPDGHLPNGLFDRLKSIEEVATESGRPLLLEEAKSYGVDLGETENATVEALAIRAWKKAPEVIRACSERLLSRRVSKAPGYEYQARADCSLSLNSARTGEERSLTSAANGRKSRGPRTAAGKTRSALNATRHGAYAESPVLPQIGESNDEWAAFREGAITDLSPVGSIEATLADRAALLMWRLRRVANAEHPQHSLRLDDIGWEAADDGRREFSLLPIRDGRVDAADRADTREYLDEIIERARRVLELGPNDPIDPEDATELFGEIEFLADAFGLDTIGDEPDPRRVEGWTVSQFEAALVEWVGHPLDANGNPDPTRRWIDAVKSSLLNQSIRHSGIEYRARIRTERLKAQRHVLDTDRFERFAKQDTHLSRALYRTLAELHRLQDRRQVATARKTKAEGEHELSDTSIGARRANLASLRVDAGIAGLGNVHELRA